MADYKENFSELEVREEEEVEPDLDFESTPQLPVTDHESDFDFGDHSDVLGTDRATESVADAAPDYPEAGEVVEPDGASAQSSSLPKSSTPKSSGSGSGSGSKSESSGSSSSSTSKSETSKSGSSS